ncbi:hypothetical protein [Streptomyces virginiae]
MTTDPDKAREWLEDWTDVSGIDGILVKNMSQGFLPLAYCSVWSPAPRGRSWS